MGTINIYIPVPDSIPDRIIRRGSGIVGQPAEGDYVLVYYEGNIYNASGLESWEAKILRAFVRWSMKYPTIARGSFTAKDLIKVGEMDVDTEVISVSDQQGVDRYVDKIQPNTAG